MESSSLTYVMDPPFAGIYITAWLQKSMKIPFTPPLEKGDVGGF